MAIKIDGLTQAIKDNLKYQTAEITSKVDKEAKNVAQQSKKIIQADSPVGRRGKYHKSWKIKKVKGVYIIHSSKEYRLTHLLEHGHILRNGKMSKAIKHIANGEEYAQAELPARIEKILKETV